MQYTRCYFHITKREDIRENITPIYIHVHNLCTSSSRHVRTTSVQPLHYITQSPTFTGSLVCNIDTVLKHLNRASIHLLEMTEAYTTSCHDNCILMTSCERQTTAKASINSEAVKPILLRVVLSCCLTHAIALNLSS